MENVYGFLSLISIILLIVGIFSPKTSLFWFKQNPSRGKSVLIYGGLIIVSGLLMNTTDYGKKADAEAKAAKAKQPVEGQSEEPVEKAVTDAKKKQAAAESEAKSQEQAEKRLKEIADQTVQARQLIQLYKANEVKADQDFKDKTFYVSGTVADIKKDIMDRVYVALDESEMGSEGVHCYFNDEQTAANLKKGQKVLFKGTGDGFEVFYVEMRDCEQIK